MPDKRATGWRVALNFLAAGVLWPLYLIGSVVALVALYFYGWLPW